MLGDRVRVLLVDDNREFTEVVREFIEGQPDMEVVGVAHNGVDGLNMACEVAPDVIVLDVIMPHLDGLGLLERLREEHFSRRPRVLILTAIGHEATAARIVAAGADYYIVKPFDLHVLMDRIRRVAKLPPDSVLPVHGSGWAPEAGKATDLEAEVTRVIHEVGIPANIRGYAYLRDAILMAMGEGHVLGSVTRVLYPTIAQRHGTTPSRVERAIRHAIEIAWTRGNVDFLNKIFGHTVDADKGRPTNSAFIARIADKIRIDMKP
ncbi:MAG: sporulation transcription factor Spo0A [Firmicutes bacterium]|jgi:two-component system response regulator (stage 0 sporulation protein A)|nr:sporulation transcription factor Spo0A [Bacillota bacterium]